MLAQTSASFKARKVSDKGDVLFTLVGMAIFAIIAVLSVYTISHFFNQGRTADNLAAVTVSENIWVDSAGFSGKFDDEKIRSIIHEEN